jgi:hypothetical protein
MVFSATLAVMSTLCKQPLALLAVGLLVYLWLADGRRTALRYLTALCGASIVLAVLCMWAFGPGELYDNLFIAARQPWGERGIAIIVQPLRTFVRFMLPVLLVAAVALVVGIMSGQWKGSRVRWLRANDWMMLFIVGLALLPSSIAGMAMIGGDVNSLSFSGFFFTIGVTCMLADSASRKSPSEARQSAIGCLMALTVLLAIVVLPVALPAKLRSLNTAEQQTVFQYAKISRHTTFFPWLPLSHLLAEGRFYHSGYGIIDRALAGEQVSREYFRAFAPAHMDSIAFGKDGPREIVGVDLLSYWDGKNLCAIHNPELASWQVYGNCASASAAPIGATAQNAGPK